MNQPPESPPEAALLKAQIEAGKRRLLEGGAQQDGFLLFSSPQEAMPKLAFLDPILEPVEKVVWANAWIHAKENGSQMAGFSSHKALAARCNIRRRQAVARSLAVLRLCRWITLCEEVRDPGGGAYRGNLYALHDEPAPLALTRELDPGYLDYLDRCRSSADPRIRDVARRVSEGIDRQLNAGHDLLSPDPVRQHDVRVEALKTIRKLEQRSRGRDQDEPGPFLFFGTRVTSNNPRPLSSAENHQVRNMNTVISGRSLEKSPSSKFEHGNFERSSSSSYISKKPTTTSPVEKSERKSRLIQPLELTDEEFDLVLHRMRNFPLEQQQDLLDELGEQIRLRKDTLNPIRNPAGYLSWLCQELEQGGQPFTSAHLERRKRRAREAKREKAERLANERAMKKLEQMLKEKGVG